MGYGRQTVQASRADTVPSFVGSISPGRLYLICSRLRANGYCLHLQHRALEFDREAGIAHVKSLDLPVVMYNLVYCVCAFSRNAPTSGDAA